MRNEMIGAVVRRAIEHPEFREKLLSDPHAALSAHGFALEQRELDELDRIRKSVGEGTDSEKELIKIAEQYGVHPAPHA